MVVKKILPEIFDLFNRFTNAATHKGNTTL